MIGTENGEEDDPTRRLVTTAATSAGVCGRDLPLVSRLERKVGIVGTRRRTSIIGAKRAWCLTGVTVGTVRITDVVDRKANGEPGCRLLEINARVRAIKSLYPVENGPSKCNELETLRSLNRRYWKSGFSGSMRRWRGLAKPLSLGAPVI